MTAKLEQAISALKNLPNDVQDAIAGDLMAEVETFTHSSLTPDQAAIVEKRLSEPYDLASSDEVTDVLRKFQVTV